MTSTLLRKPVAWIALLIVSALCVFTVLRYFGDAFSVLDLDVTMSRDDAIREARRIAGERQLATGGLPRVLTEAVASFDGDATAQTFIELEGGGKPALKPLIGGDAGDGRNEFTLYKWRVRLYAPQSEPEVQIAFTPDGRPSGFFSKVPEAAPGAALSAKEARTIATTVAARDWAVDFERYRLLTESATTRPRGRVDHTFVYERKAGSAPAIGDGRFRLRLVVSGDRLTQLQRFVFVPEAFTRRYETLRSVNDNIAAAASIVAGLLYGLGGCLVGLIWLMRRRAVRWGPAMKWAGVVALLIGGASLASISASWFDYDTAKSASTHLFTHVAGAIVGAIVTWLLLTVVFATAEGLGRQAFGTHPRLWRTWRTPSAISRAIWGRTLAGYAWIGFDLAFIAGFYFVVQRHLGWWSPSDALIDPNILGTRQPWLAPVSMALQAGMMEESLFRAVPLAGAALLGRRFGREKLFVVVALVLQAVVFGCAHANYPGQPAYARPIELFLPSLVWGVVYLRYGLVPGMLFHFGFDLVLMSIPLFVTEVPGIAFDRAMVIGVFALPLAVLVVQRLRAGRLIDLPDSERNASAAASGASRTAAAVVDAVDEVGAASEAPSVSSTAVPDGAPDSRRHAIALATIAIVGVIGIGIRLAQPFDAPGLSVDRTEAVAIAERALAARGTRLDDRWHRTARAVRGSDEAASRFVWREGGKTLYSRLIGGPLAPPHWEVRFARFDGDVADRDAWRVTVVDDRPAPDGVRLIEHDVPEARPGRHLTEAEARPLAEAAVADRLKLPVASLRAVSAEATEQPARIDWVFTYTDATVAMPAGGEARVVVEIDGDEVVAVGRTLFVPDAWSRDERRRDEGLIVPRALLGFIGAAFVLVCLVSLVRSIARGEASARAAWVAALITVPVLLVGAFLGFNATESGFTVAEPFGNQLLRVALQWLGLAASGGLFAALIAAVGVRIASRTEDRAPPSSGRWVRWAPALAIAAIVAGASGLSSLLGAASSPRVPSVEAASSWSPWLTALIGQIDFTAAASAALLGALALSTRRRRNEIALVVAIVIAALLGRASSMGAGPVAIVASGIAGLVGWWIFRTWLRGRPGVVAPLILCVVLTGFLSPLVHPGFPGAQLAAVAGIVSTLFGYAVWRWLVKQDEPRAAPLAR